MVNVCIVLLVIFMLLIIPALRHDAAIRKVYSIDKRTIPSRIRAALRRSK